MNSFLKKGGWVLILAVIIFGLRSISKYNVLIGSDEEVKRTWADVETQYQRRADLIPNLVNTVKGFADQELEVLTQVTEARAKASSTTVNIDDPASLAQFQAVQGEVSSALSRLLVTVEAYPELKSNENFLNLQTQLEGTENRINVARTKYNEAIQRYNTMIRSFPANIVAGLAGLRVRVPFEADEGAEDAPTVDFGGDSEAADDTEARDDTLPTTE